MVDQNQSVTRVNNSSGQPYGAAVDDEGAVFVADMAHAAIVVANPDEKHQMVVRVYEDKPFKGPHSLCFDRQGTMYFTDAGPLGETGLHNPSGSLFCITGGQSGQMLKPVALEWLAYPSGVAVSPDDRCVYVCEQMVNRVVRFVQRPSGVYHASVFYQFSGGLGPSCCACDGQGNLYVASYDFTGSTEGSIYGISPEGKLFATLTVPGPEITGITINQDTNRLYATEASTASIYYTDL